MTQVEGAVLEALRAWADPRGLCQVSLSDLCADLGISRRIALEALRSLNRQGAIRLAAPGRGRVPAVYQVNLESISVQGAGTEKYALREGTKGTFSSSLRSIQGTDLGTENNPHVDDGKGVFGSSLQSIQFPGLTEALKDLADAVRELTREVRALREAVTHLVPHSVPAVPGETPPSSPLSAAPLPPTPPNTPPPKPPISPLESPPIIPPTGLEEVQGEGEGRERKPEENPKPSLSGQGEVFDPSKPTGGAREAGHEPADLAAALRAKGEVGEWALRILQAAPGRLHANLPKALALLELHGPEVARELWEHARATAEHSPLGAWLRYADPSVPLPPEVRARLRERLEAQPEPPPPPPPEDEEEVYRRYLQRVAAGLDEVGWIQPLWQAVQDRRNERDVIMACQTWREEIGKVTAFPKPFITPANVVRLLSGWVGLWGDRLLPGSRARFRAARTPEEKVAVLREIVRDAIPPREGRGWDWVLERWRKGEEEITDEERREQEALWRRLEVIRANAASA